jgi:hypothetical protein
MGPTQVDPLVHARSIVRKCMVRDACTEFAAAGGTQWVAGLRAFGRHHEGSSVEASSTESLSPSGQRISKPIVQLTKAWAAAFLALSCIIMVALVASRSLGVHY